MNNDLSLWDSKLLLPTSFEQACQGLQTLEAGRPGPNPKFLALAQALQSAPGVDARWSASLAEWTRRVPEAVWHLSLPVDDRISALQAVVEQATAIGLVVLSEPLGMAFLPNGGILPPELHGQWTGLLAQVKASPPLANGSQQPPAAAPSISALGTKLLQTLRHRNTGSGRDPTLSAGTLTSV